MIAVASVDLTLGEWRAFIGPVPGERHEHEWRSVKDFGNPLREDVAEVVFPEVASMFAWKD